MKSLKDNEKVVCSTFKDMFLEKVTVVEIAPGKHSCGGCIYNLAKFDIKLCEGRLKYIGFCTSDERKDGKNVIFKLAENDN